VIRRRALLALALALAGCAPRAPIAAAIRARGGPLAGIVREVETDVRAGVPGTWTWRTVFRVPDLYAWTVYTVAEPNHVIFDGSTVRTYVADRVVATETGTTSPLRTHARLTAVMYLDALLLPGVAVAPLASGDVPAGAASGVEAVFGDDGSRYRLGFDRNMQLVALDGPLALPPIGTGSMRMRFSDFRRVERWILPYMTAYTFRDVPIATERTVSACPDPPGLDPSAFRTPAALPECPPS
jgi:hypothetical protein